MMENLQLQDGILTLYTRSELYSQWVITPGLITLKYNKLLLVLYLVWVLLLLLEIVNIVIGTHLYSYSNTSSLILILLSILLY